MAKELGFVLLLLAITLPNVNSFDVYFLALTWPNAYCNVKINSCTRPVAQDFTIHGLWPGWLSTGRTITNCQAPALQKKQVASLRKDLEHYWPSLRRPIDRKTDSHFEFWEAQWKKHGSCSGLDPATYFDLAIQFRKRSNLLNVFGHEGIVPGSKLYLPDKIQSAIENAWSTTPQLKCNKDFQQDLQLVEIVLCIKTPTQQSKHHTICSCQGNSITASCVDQYKKKLYLPPFTTLVDWARYEGNSEL